MWARSQKNPSNYYSTSDDTNLDRALELKAGVARLNLAPSIVRSSQSQLQNIALLPSWTRLAPHWTIYGQCQESIRQSGAPALSVRTHRWVFSYCIKQGCVLRSVTHIPFQLGELTPGLTII